MDKKPFGNVPMPAEPVNLTRASVNGITDKIPDLKTAIAAMDLDEHLKAYIASELDEVETNAAEVHLHDIEMPSGGFNLHLCIKPMQLGLGTKSVFFRKS